MVSAPSEHKEDLLKELERFAFRGIPKISCSPRPNLALSVDVEEDEEENDVGNVENDEAEGQESVRNEEEEEEDRAEMVRTLI